MSVPVPELAPLTPAARRILDAASNLFYQRGIHAVGVDTIAEAAGVTKKTLYDRFGSKEALVLSYLQHRDQLWREHVETRLAGVREPGNGRVLAIFDAAISWSDAHGAKGCSAINARAEVGEAHDGNLIFPEVARQKAWLFEAFLAQCAGAGLADPDDVARAMMLLYEGAIVTVGMETFDQPFRTARHIARELLEQSSGSGCSPRSSDPGR